jgi:nitroreductase
MENDRQQGRVSDDPSRMLDDLVFGRRSIRKYKKDPLPEPWLVQMLQCAHQAPSPSNSQPVRFVHIKSRHHIETLKRSLVEGHERLIAKNASRKSPARLRNRINAYYRYAQFMFSAPVLLAVGVTTETEGFSSRLLAAGLIKENLRHHADVDMTVGLALQGLMLKARSLGVGSCILTAPLVFMEDVAPLLALEKIIIKCFVTLGIAAETPTAPERLPLQAVFQEI